MSVINEINRLGRQGFFCRCRRTSNNGKRGLVYSEAGRCMGDNRFLTTSFVLKWQYPKATLFMGDAVETVGWDRKSSKILKKFTNPSPALFGLE